MTKKLKSISILALALMLAMSTIQIGLGNPDAPKDTDFYTNNNGILVDNLELYKDIKVESSLFKMKISPADNKLHIENLSNDYIRITVYQGKKSASYYISTTDFIPLLIDGEYKIKISTKNTDSFKYTIIETINIEAKNTADDSVYLGQQYYSRYSPDDEAFVAKVNELWEKSNNTNEYIRNCFNYVSGFKYDNVKAKNIASYGVEYRESIATTMANKIGICQDQSSVMASLLRAKGIPVKVAHGLIDNKTKHQWLEVKVDGVFKTFDPTNSFDYNSKNAARLTVLSYK